MRDRPEWVTIGRVTKPHGIRGELKVIGVDNDVARFRGISAVVLELPRGERARFPVEQFRTTGREILLKLSGLDTRTEAEKWRSASVLIHIDEVPPLEEDSYYAFDLVGLEVFTTSGRRLGKVEEVQEFPANDVLVVRDGEREILFPAVAELVEEIDLEAGVLRVKEMEGLTE